MGTVGNQVASHSTFSCALCRRTNMYTKRLKQHVVTLALAASSVAAQRQCEPLSCDPVDLTIWTEYHAAALEEHNKYREKHAGTPCLELDDDLTEEAQQWAEFVKTNRKPNGPRLWVDKNAKQGQSMYFLSKMLVNEEDFYNPEGLYPKVLKRAIKYWYEKNRFYKYFGKRSSSAFTKSLVFTQLVWKDTSKLGIGITHERGEGDWSHYMRFWIVARYSKQGNLTVRKWNETADVARARTYDANVGMPCN